MPPKSPRRQAKQARSKATVDAILEAAARVVAANGYAGASTNRMAETAGVSIATLYEYFANKDEVYVALIERELDALVTIFGAKDLDPALSLVEKLALLLRMGMASMRYGPELFRALEQVPEARLRRRLSGARSQVVGFVRGLLEEHRDELRVADLDRAAFIVVSGVEGVANAARWDQFDESLADELETLLRLYLTRRTRQQLVTIGYRSGGERCATALQVSALGRG